MNLVSRIFAFCIVAVLVSPAVLYWQGRSAFGEPIIDGSRLPIHPNSLKVIQTGLEDTLAVQPVGIEEWVSFEICSFFAEYEKRTRKNCSVESMPGFKLARLVAETEMPESVHPNQRELVIQAGAMWLSQNYDYEELASHYFSQAYLGAGLYGAQAAAEQVFNVPAHRLGQPHWAYIVNLSQNPKLAGPAYKSRASKEMQELLYRTQHMR